ncbi:hypothetical protein [Maribacter sp. ACAM166]|uniref:hypothetical protein n=1 Tax=Maribacter sp. ACAM166 TaxID=2508996 RepID=UPI001484CF35|nr:hypothetical protein [Maribacter sp. ACAM166]
MYRIYKINPHPSPHKMWYVTPGVFSMDKKKAAQLTEATATDIQFRLRSLRVETIINP